MTKTDKSGKSAEERFWEWFSEHADAYMAFEENLEQLVEPLGDALSLVAEGLTFEISSKESYGRDLIISADGNQALFSAVLRLVAAAPIIPYWRIIPLRPSRGTNFNVRFGEEELSLDDVWFSVYPNVRLLDVAFFLPKCRDITTNIQAATILALDAALGEYDVETKIGKFDWKHLPDSPKAAGLQRFSELPSVVSEWTPPSTPLRVFLCHANEDKPLVRELYSKLQRSGFDPWFDEEDLLPGVDWKREINKALNACDVAIVCLSARSVTKTGYLQKEIREIIAIADLQPEDKVFVIPIKLQECTVPYSLNRWQWLNLFEKRGYQKLVNALQLRASELRHM